MGFNFVFSIKKFINRNTPNMNHQDWLSSFLLQPASKYFVIIDYEYLNSISHQYLNEIPYGEFAKKRILNQEFNEADIPNEGLMESAAEMLYGIVHQDFIKTDKGLDLMKIKFMKKEFGSCPRIYCRNTPLLPFGLFDKPGMENVKLLCCNCLDLYRTNGVMEILDGAFFGNKYASFFFEKFEMELLNLAKFTADDSSSDSFITSEASSISIQSIHESLNDQVMYIPRIFGFRVNENAEHGPKNAWLRSAPGIDYRKGI
eukprot:NODE_239_length_11955_cov_0.931174.p6 type:complete len:259 gc:universal NODE_239_length_11955_cov_0.931174:1117-1893(+)